MNSRLLIGLFVAPLFFWAVQGNAADRQNGRLLYDLHCMSCHGEQGHSIDPMTPSFANGDLLFLMDSELIGRIRNGKDAMPAFRGLLSDEEIRDVISFLRTF